MSGNLDVMKYEREVTSPERFFSRSPFSIVTMVARIKGYITAEMLNNAVGKVQQRHALLRFCIKEDDDHTLWFSSAGVQAIPVEIVPRNSKDDWIKVHAEALKVPFEFETQPAIRFILVHSMEVSELIIVCHHIICDGMSLAYLARDIMVHLGNPEIEVEVSPAPPAIDLENLPDDVTQSSIVKYFIKRMNRKWIEDPEYFDSEDYRVLTKAYWDSYSHAFICLELSEAETSDLVARCRKEATTVNSALTAAFCGAQSFVEGEQPYHPKVVVAVDLRDRIPHSPGEGMGMYAGGAELKFKYNHKRNFWENARNFNEKIQPKYTNKNLFSNINNWLYLEQTILDAIPFKELGGLVPPESSRYEKLSTFRNKEDVVLGILKQDNLDTLDAKLWGTAVTNLGRLDFPSTYGSLELERLILQPGGGFPLTNVNLVIGAVTCSEKLSLIVEYAEQSKDVQIVAAIKDKAMQYLLGE
jgi:NRPS condensation-like uncharacterized protein